jgi:DNA-binding NarL/FixJ family response regulator
MNTSTNSIAIPLPSQLPLGGAITRLTKREWEVILCLSKGMTTPQIALQISIEPKSVDNYRTRIATKLGLKGRNKLAWYSWTHQRDLAEWYNIFGRL